MVATMTTRVRWAAVAIAALTCAGPAGAQEPAPAPTSRASILEKAQADKAADLRPYEPNRVEKALNRVEKILRRGVNVHPFFDSAYSGGGFTLGAGYIKHVSDYNTIDFRGSITFSGYKRIESEFLAPRLFNRRGRLSLLGGWRDATAVGFYGLGTENTSANDRANYSFEQPYGSAVLDFWPTRKFLLLRGGLDLSTWNTASGKGPEPPIDDVYTPETLPGLGGSPTYLHSEATVGIDTRTSPGYTRKGSYLGASFHNFHDSNGQFGFHQTDYEAIQHIPILKETWVVALHARAELGDQRRRPGRPVFHDAGPRRRNVAARVLELAVPRSEQPAPPGGVADHRQPHRRNGALLRRRPRHLAAQRSLRRPSQERLRRRLPAARAFATPLRVEFAHGNEGLVAGLFRKGAVLGRHRHAHRSPRPCRCLALRADTWAPPPPSASSPTIRSRASRRARTRPAPSRPTSASSSTSPSTSSSTSRREPGTTRAGNVNTIDEVPDSSWFTNRILRGRLGTTSSRAAPIPARRPIPERWVVIREKSAGASPGFTATDASGETWFISFDSPRNPEAATGAMVVANKILLGARLQPGGDLPHEGGSRGWSRSIRPRRSAARTARRRRCGATISNAVFERAAKSPDGTYRAAAGRQLSGKVLGPFRYEGTRPDDPNDVVDHEHRRELRALRVFGAWTNLTDLKSGNTLDTLVTVNGRSVVRHYLQDVGSTFGIGANGPHDYDEGFEYVYQGVASRKRLATLGFALSPWQTADYPNFPSIGRFESDKFDPTKWKPHSPTTGYMEMQPTMRSGRRGGWQPSAMKTSGQSCAAANTAMRPRRRTSRPHWFAGATRSRAPISRR